MNETPSSSSAIEALMIDCAMDPNDLSLIDKHGTKYIRSGTAHCATIYHAEDGQGNVKKRVLGRESLNFTKFRTGNTTRAVIGGNSWED